jgi:hypothetical protein
MAGPPRSRRHDRTSRLPKAEDQNPISPLASKYPIGIRNFPRKKKRGDMKVEF